MPSVDDFTIGGSDSGPSLPVFELSSYEPVEVVMPVFKVTSDQVKARMDEIVKGAPPEYEPTGRKVAGPKDSILIKSEATLEGEVVNNLTFKERLYVLGDGMMPIGFDRNVVGMRVGESKEFDFMAPTAKKGASGDAQYHTTVELLGIMRKKEPVVNDEWVCTVLNGYESVEDFRKKTKEALEKEASEAVEDELDQRAVAALCERFQSAIGDAIYESARDDIKKSVEQQLNAQGSNIKNYMAQQGMDEQQFNMMLMLQARDMLTQGFSLDAWARHYGIEPSEEDILAMAEIMMPGHGADYMARIAAQEDMKQREGLIIAARRYLANKDLTSKAKIIQE